MTLRKPHTLKDFTANEADHLDDNVGRLYSHKLESRLKFEGSSTASTSVLYQSLESGQFQVSANGSATVVKTFALAEPKSTIVCATAHAVSSLVSAHVIDVTSCQVTIECRTISGTANFSNVTTATIQVFYKVLGGD